MEERNQKLEDSKDELDECVDEWLKELGLLPRDDTNRKLGCGVSIVMPGCVITRVSKDAARSLSPSGKADATKRGAISSKPSEAGAQSIMTGATVQQRLTAVKRNRYSIK